MEYKGYKPTVGLEVHVELKTEKKAFCNCSAVYGGEANSKCCPVCMGEPEAYPVLNPDAVRLGCMAGLALGCRINKVSRFDRKHYSYPDLPKGYQLTQYYEPICTDGKVNFLCDGREMTVRIERIHLEEDAGKLTYKDGAPTVDYNRCGVPLIEIVTKPDIHSAEEAMAFVEELRRTLLFAGVSDCKMNEGSLRCDVNISVSPADSDSLGDRCEIKNINSVYFIGKAIEYETVRQTELLLSGGSVTVETRRFSEESGTTSRMRDKESAEDYGYSPDPFLPPVITDEEYIASLRKAMPKSVGEYMEAFGGSGVKKQDAELICTEPLYAEYFAAAAARADTAGTVASLFISEVLPCLKSGKPVIAPEALADVSVLYDRGDVNIVSARRLVSVCAETGESPKDASARLKLSVIRDRAELRRLVSEAAEGAPKAAADIRGGKASAKKVIVGQVMKATGGRADPTAVNEEVDLYFAERQNPHICKYLKSCNLLLQFAFKIQSIVTLKIKDID